MTQHYDWFVGIDWGSADHAITVLDGAGTVRGRRTVPHTVDAVHEALVWLRELTGAVPDAIAMAIETPRGALVATLLEQGYPVFAINPKQLDRFRDRFTAAGAKDDSRDAHVLADALRTDRRAFRHVPIDDPLIIQLRELQHTLEDLQTDEGRLTNRLREQLYRVNAAWLAWCPAADEAWLWTMLAAAPDPTTWEQLRRRQVAAVLRAHRIRRLTPDEIVHGLRQPHLAVAAGVAEAVALRIATLVPQLQVLRDQRGQVERRMDRMLRQLAEAPREGESHEHRDVEILQSLPGVGRMVTATMLTEATGALADRNYAILRTHTGAAPVTRRSGKRSVVRMRYACKPRLRQAIFHWARVSIQRDPAARAYYAGLRARGHQHARALRSVADRWLRILTAMLKHRTLYDPSRFSTDDPVSVTA